MGFEAHGYWGQDVCSPQGHHPRCKFGLYHENMTANGRRCISSQVVCIHIYIHAIYIYLYMQYIYIYIIIIICSTSYMGVSQTWGYAKLGSLLFRKPAHPKTTEANQK